MNFLSDQSHSIIFSYWRQSLHKLAGILEKANIRFVVLEGSLSLSERRSVLDLFMKDADIPVLLMTLGTGAVGYVLPPPLILKAKPISTG
jgi:SWI/SNF-related matrix-associated actin-dependent regulator of chromatin subfamily A3